MIKLPRSDIKIEASQEGLLPKPTPAKHNNGEARDKGNSQFRHFSQPPKPQPAERDKSAQSKGRDAYDVTQFG